jgi:glutamate dehydrogenase
MFVPCGGRPESIDISSASKLIVDGKCTIPYIVEGANLFITQDAKLRLEKAGCILYKDASANKGGVTSSSLEVLASLSFDDAGFIQNMCIGEDGTTPEFYNNYVKEIQEIIKRNARLEFEAVWREHKETGEARSTVSDKLSVAITQMDEELQNSDLWQDEEFRLSVLHDALPQLLLEKVGLATLVERVSHIGGKGFQERHGYLQIRSRFRTITSERFSAAIWRAGSFIRMGSRVVRLHSSRCKCFGI